jgi:hypothetical protein
VDLRVCAECEEEAGRGAMTLRDPVQTTSTLDAVMGRGVIPRKKGRLSGAKPCTLLTTWFSEVPSTEDAKENSREKDDI